MRSGKTIYGFGLFFLFIYSNGKLLCGGEDQQGKEVGGSQKGGSAPGSSFWVFGGGVLFQFLKFFF